MNKYIKLALIAIILVGGIIAYFLVPRSESVYEPELYSSAATEWKGKIDQFCQNTNWSTDGYLEIEKGIYYDWEVSNGEVISDSELRILYEYLFSMSCSHLWEAADEHFKKAPYEDSMIKTFVSGRTLLASRAKEYSKNGNQLNFSELVGTYGYIMGAIHFDTKPKYSKPFPSFSKEKPEEVQKRIMGLRFYKSHFSKNPAIKSKVEAYIDYWKKAEQEFYSNLEKEIEKHYLNMKDYDLVTIMQDQLDFLEVSTNAQANQALEYFIQN